MWSEWKTHTLLQIQIKNAENLNIWKGNLGWDVENYEKIFRSEYKWPNWSYTMLFFSELGILFSESGDVWKISWNLKIVATSVDTSNKNFQNSQNHIVVVFSGSHDIEISADFSDVSWFTGLNDYWIVPHWQNLTNRSCQRRQGQIYEACFMVILTSWVYCAISSILMPTVQCKAAAHLQQQKKKTNANHLRPLEFSSMFFSVESRKQSIYVSFFFKQI